MSRKKKRTAKNQDQQDVQKKEQQRQEQEKEKARLEQEKTALENSVQRIQIFPEAPATAKQRELLRRAIQKNWLSPNPFVEGNYRKWEKLTAGEADKLLASIPPERLGILEKELSEKEHSPGKGMGITRSVGRATEEIIGMIGRSIDGGIG